MEKRFYLPNEKSTPSPTEVLSARTFTSPIVHKKSGLCNLEVYDIENFDVFDGVKSISKRLVWFHLFYVGAGHFVTKSSVAKDLGLKQSVVGRCLYSLKMDGKIDYTYYCNNGYLIQNVSKIEFDNFHVEAGCPYGFPTDHMTDSCARCLFMRNCRRTESWRNRDE